MSLEQRITAFSTLGRFLSQFSSETPQKIDDLPKNNLFFDGMSEALLRAQQQNAWFTLPHLRLTLQHWSDALSEENLKKWLASYEIHSPENQKTIGIVMAGNIPLVGFHDLLCVVLCGHKVQAKLSSNDTVLLPFLASYLEAIAPQLKGCIQFTEDRLEDFDAVIATGSNNTARYFEQYFGKYPNIIRKNRNGVAVLTGTETHEELLGLSEDIFRYFGLGCRNVSKLYVPKGYSFDAFFNAMYEQRDVINHHKYINNYDYNKAVYLMGELSLLDNEFMLLKKDSAMASPISVVFYEYYEDLASAEAILKEQEENIQVLVGNSVPFETVPLGKAQEPNLWDYADGVDTVNFLLNLS
ncbi:MAG: acyl-CoA reductase [Flavobacteriaceae bacterium]|nr:acyl-CoA reductase [Flavobacteriaceae bacterium]|tara:strand:+ start:5977 stop:7041 length:1065 start_codon:yes stop_codon:yes gene_type:complete